MSIALIAVLTIIAVSVLARAAYVMWYNSTLRKAERAMRKADFHEAMAEMADTNWETYERYAKARYAYRRAARLYIRLGKRSSTKFAVSKSVEMRKLYEKYLYL